MLRPFTDDELLLLFYCLSTPLPPVGVARGTYQRKDDDRHAFHRVFFSTPPFVRVEGVVLRRKKRFRHKDARDKLTSTSRFLRWVYGARAEGG